VTNYAQWRDSEIALLNTHWPLGASDARLAKALGRTRKSVEFKRHELGLVAESFPDRPKEQEDPTKYHRYTSEEGTAILARFDNGEAVASIALSYNVSRRAMEGKIDKLLASKPAESRLAPTPRNCLRCQKSFWSDRPKSEHRRCPSCEIAVAKEGTTFLSL
jgi:hypothetical protein